MTIGKPWSCFALWLPNHFKTYSHFQKPPSSSAAELKFSKESISYVAS